MLPSISAELLWKGIICQACTVHILAQNFWVKLYVRSPYLRILLTCLVLHSNYAQAPGTYFRITDVLLTCRMQIQELR